MSDVYAASPMLKHVAGLSREGLEALQLAKVQRLATRLHATNPYYRRRMDTAGLTPERLTSLEVFRQRFPLSSKADFLADQLATPPFGQRLGIDPRDIALINTTGGTSGLGQEIYGRSHRDVHLLGHLHALPWVLGGLRPGDVAINCVPAGGMTTGGWGPGEGMRIVGAAGFQVGGALSTDAKIDLMLKLGRVNFIYASTNYLHTLTGALLKRGIDPKEAFPQMHGLFIAAEGYPLEWAEQIETHWGCRLQEGYGSTQCNGFGGSTCADGVFGAKGGRGLIRLFEWETLFEILDPDTLEPTRPGEVGEMVITNLSVEGSPVVRFRTGDAARYIDWREVDDGRAWSAIECGTIGRFDDMMKIRGANVWPGAIDAVVFACPEVSDYAGRVFTIEGRTDVEMRVAFAEGAGDLPAERRTQVLAAIREGVKARTNLSVAVIETPRADLPEFDYKSRRWKDERQEGYRL